MARRDGTFAVLDGALSMALHGTERAIRTPSVKSGSRLQKKPARKTAPHGEDGL